MVGGDMGYTCLGDNVYVVSMNYYRDCTGITAPTSLTFTFSSIACAQNVTHVIPQVSSQEISSICPAQIVNSTCNGGTLPGVEQYVYSDTITLPDTCSDWNINFNTCCRSGAITNLLNGSSEDLRIDIGLDNTNGLCNNSPIFNDNPAPYICAGVETTLDIGAVDPDGDQLVYSIVQPLDNLGDTIAYAAGLSIDSPLATIGPFIFNSATGTMTFTPSGAQVAAITILVEEYRNGQLIGTSIRDIQVVVIANCANSLPLISDVTTLPGGGSLVDTNVISACPGDTILFTILATDGDLDTLSLSGIGPGGASISTSNPVHYIGSAGVSWVPTSADAGTSYFIFTATDDACPITGTTSKVIQVNVINSVDAGPDQLYCDGGDPVLVEVIGGANFSWNPTTGIVASNPDSSVVWLEPSTTTIYSVTAAQGTSCSISDTVMITVVPGFSLFMSTDATVCAGSNVNLVAFGDPGQAPYTYDWTPAVSLNNPAIFDPVATPFVTTTYVAELTSAAGCVKRDSVTLLVSGQAPPANISTDTSLCLGQVTELTTCNVPFTFQDRFDPVIDGALWSAWNGVANTSCGAVAGNALYFDALGVRQAATIDLDVTGGAQLSFYLKIAGLGSTIPCDPAEAGEHVNLQYSTDGGLVWITLGAYQPGSFDNFTLVNATVPIVAQTASTRFRWVQLSNTGPGNDNWAIDEITITGGCGANLAYQWVPTTGLSDPNGPNPIANLSTTTTYTVTITDTLAGCAATASVTLHVGNSFSYSISNDDTTCAGAGVPLTVSADTNEGPYMYLWNPPTGLTSISIANPIAAPLQTTTYTVTITSLDGCVQTDSITVYVLGTPPVVNVRGDSLLCLGEFSQLDACAEFITDDFDPGIITANWSVNTGIASAVCGSVSGNALYFNTLGTREATTLDLNVATGGLISFYLKIATGSSAPCETADINEHVELEYSLNGGVTWIQMDSFNQTSYPSFTLITRNIPVAAQSNSTRFRWVQYLNSGVDFDNWALDDVSISTTCTGALIYTWTPPTGLSSTSIPDPIALPSSTTTYTVHVIDPITGCSATDQITIYVGAEFSNTILNDDSICLNSSIQLSVVPEAAHGPYTFSWSPAGSLSDPNIANPVATPTVNTTYVVTMQSANGCIKSDTVTIHIIGQGPTVLITHDNDVCPGDSVQITSDVFDIVCGLSQDPCTTPTTVEYGNSTTIQNGTPFMGGFEDSRTQILYLASDLHAAGLSAGTINGIALLIGSKASTGAYNNFQIRMGCTSLASLSTAAWEGGTTVVLGPATWASSLFWNSFTFNSPYLWDGNSNLIVEICFDNATGVGPGGLDDLFQNSVPYTGTVRNYLNGTVGCSIATPAFASSVVPNTQFFACSAGGSTLTYTWTPATGLNNASIASPIAHVTDDVTYTFTVGDSVCSTSVIVQIDVDDSYSLAASGDTMIQPGDSVQIFANTTGNPPTGNLTCGTIGTNCSTTSAQHDVGTGTTFYTGGTTHPSPYGHYYEGGKHQMLYRASELQAAGISSGTLSEIALNVANLMGTTQYCDWTISVGCTQATELTTWETGLLQVFDPKVITVSLGWNTHSFDRNFDWDGVSNLVVEICFQNDVCQATYSNNSATYYTTTGYNSMVYTRLDNNPLICSQTTLPTISADRPNTRFTVCPAPSGQQTYSWTPTTGLSNPNIMDPVASPATTTTYVVSVTYVDGCTRYDTVIVEVEEGCETVPHLWTSNVTVTSARLNWTPVADAQIYRIRGRLQGATSWVNIVSPATPPFFNANNLNAFTTYEWQIQTVCDVATNDTSGWSPLDVFTTGCTPVDSHWTSIVTISGARLSWQQGAGASAYEIRGRNAASVNWVSILVGPSNNSKDVFGLLPGTTYEWTIRKWCDTAGIKKSPFRPLIQFTTLSAERMGNLGVNDGFSFETGMEWDVYPNPASEAIEVAFSNIIDQGQVDLHLTDINGRVVKSWATMLKSADKSVQLDLSDLAAGVYQLSMQSATISETRKIVKVK